MEIIKGIASIVIVIVAIIVVLTLLVSGLSWMLKDAPSFHRDRVEKTLECIERTNDKEWCLNNFI